MPVYAKFMKEILSGKCKLKYDENITLVEECSAIIQRELPSKLSNQSRVIIPCSIGSLTIGHALCDLGANIYLMYLSMMIKLNFSKQKKTRMNLTLDNCSATYPYGVLEERTS